MSRNTVKQKLKDLRTKLSNLDIEIRALLSKGEMEPDMIDAVTADIDNFTSEISTTRKEINALKKDDKLDEESMTGGEGYSTPKAFKKINNESISLKELYNEIKKEKLKSPDEINKLALDAAKKLDIPDYILDDERLFANFMNTLKHNIQPQKLKKK